MEKPSRNATCPCGSGKKFKRCCIDIWDRLAAGEVVPDPQCEIDDIVDNAYDKGIGLIRSGKYDQAEELIRGIKQDYPEYPEPLMLEMEWGKATENWEVAVKACELLAQFTSPVVELMPDAILEYQENAALFRAKITQ